jgi:PAS domain S-box-containing protein
MAESERSASASTERRLELLINAIVDYAVYMLDADGRVATWNAGAERIKGYRSDEIVGRHFSQFFTPEDRTAGVPETALRTSASEGRFEAEGWRVRKDGTRFWANSVVDPIRDEEGRLIGFAKVTRDMTEKREAARALFESEQRFRLLVEGVRDHAIYMLDTEGRITNWNPGARNIKGYSASEIVGQHFSRFYTPEDKAKGLPNEVLRIALERGKFEGEGWRVRKDGSRFWASVHVEPLYDDEGTLIGFVKITRDSSERRAAERELEQAREAVFQAQKLQALGELTGGVAHDFNNLMTIIRGSVDLLRRGDLTKARRTRYLDAIAETTERAASLTSHLLAFGRKQPLRPAVIDLPRHFDALGEMLARTICSRIKVAFEAAPDIWRIEVDPTELQTALLNAAFNARDAMPDGGTLRIAARNRPGDPDMVEILVIDTGVGMPPDVRERAFEPFFTTKPVGEGTGLGLSQIYGFTAQSGGRAEIEDNREGGTIVRLLLPRTLKPFRAARPGQDIVRGEGLTVLLVEDNEQVRGFARDMLEDLGYAVICAESAEAALERIGNGVDILFSDVVMPGATGVELAHRARAKRPELPILLATGYSEEVGQGAADDFATLRKPYDAAALGSALATIRARPAQSD